MNLTTTTPLDLSPAAYSYLLALADDEHMVGSRHANWIGMGPFLEEDLAFCSIAQDELGHALALYELLVPGDKIDHYALLRDPADYRSSVLAELECETWDLALVRHWLYDHAEEMRWATLRQSSIAPVAELAVQVEREEVFHRSHAEMYMQRVVKNGDARDRVERALAVIAPLAGSMFSAPEAEEQALAEGVACTPLAELAETWHEWITERCTELGLALPMIPLPPRSIGRTTRSEGFEEFHASLGEVISLDTAATW